MRPLFESPFAFAIKSALAESLAANNLNATDIRDRYAGLVLARSKNQTHLSSALSDDGWSIISSPSTPPSVVGQDDGDGAASDDSPGVHRRLSTSSTPTSADFSTDPAISGSACIIGAGMAGLYTAALLDSLDLPYTLYEASKDRIGGRVFTHYFSAECGEDEARKKHRYVELGAMRFHEGPSMARVFHLFKKLDIPLLPFQMASVNAPIRYNDIVYTLKDLPDPSVDCDPFRVGHSHGGPVPDETLQKGSNGLGVFLEGLTPLLIKLVSDPKNGLAKLIEKYDNVSIREYFNATAELDFATMQWIEVLIGYVEFLRPKTAERQNDLSNGSRVSRAEGMFNWSIIEILMELVQFAGENKDQNWMCIDGGTSVLPNTLAASLKSKPMMNSRVTAIRANTNTDSSRSMSVTLADGTTKTCNTVFTATNLSALHRIDLTSASLPYATKHAISCVEYDTSTKVGILFSNAWWRTRCGIRTGGSGATDLPIRQCLYPSYNVHESDDESNVLLVSYSWAQDALRLGALISGDSGGRGEEELVGLILRDLALLHAPYVTEEELRGWYVEHKAWAWSHDRFAGDAFANFYPGQFTNTYPLLTQPHSNGRLHIIGEASSVHHSWILGALESSYRGVHDYLVEFGQDARLAELERVWGAGQWTKT